MYSLFAKFLLVNIRKKSQKENQNIFKFFIIKELSLSLWRFSKTAHFL